MKKIGKAIARKFKNWKGTTNAKVTDMENSDTPADVEEVKVEIKKQKPIQLTKLRRPILNYMKISIKVVRQNNQYLKVAKKPKMIQ